MAENKPVATPAPNSDNWKVRARFVGFQAPMAWSMPDDRNPGQMRSGTTYRVDVRVEEGTVLMRVNEEIYKNMERDNLQFGDVLEIHYGRTVGKGEMRVNPVAFHRVGA